MILHWSLTPVWLVSLLFWAILGLAGCASVARTEGTSGPLAWRVTDLGIVTRNIQGQAVDTYDFTLAIKNVSGRTLTLTKMHRTVYQAGGGQPGHSSMNGRWELAPGGEWKFPLYSYTSCTESQGCLDRRNAQPLWQIVFTGADDQDRPIENRLEIILPPRPAEHVDLGAVRRKLPPAEPPPVSAAGVASRPAQGTTAAPAMAREASTNLVVEVPTWRPGYEWEYSWKSPQGSGTFVWSVNRVDAIEGTEYYVVRGSEGREIYWRKHDRAYYMEKIPAGIETRNVPPSPIPWPLAIGKSWESHYTRERPLERATSEELRSCVVEKQEQVTVPAGTFATLKVACSDPRRQQVVLEVWYSPDVKQWVKERGHFFYGVRDRELLRYHLE